MDVPFYLSKETYQGLISVTKKIMKNVGKVLS